MSFNIGSFFADVQKAGLKIGEFLVNAVKLGSAIKQMWAACGPQTLTVASQVFYDTVKTVTLATADAGDASAGNWTGAVQLTEQTIASVKQLVADAKRGEQQIVQDFKTLQYDFLHPTTP